MGYKIKSQLNINLSNLGDNNGTPFFIAITNPKMLTFQEKMQAAKFSIPEGTQLTPEQIAERAVSMKPYVQGFIKSWNLLDKETEQPVAFDASDALDRVPSEVVEAILLEIGKTAEKDDETKNSSLQLDKSSETAQLQGESTTQDGTNTVSA